MEPAFFPNQCLSCRLCLQWRCLQGLDVYNLPKSKIEFMQNTVRILSGLYGLLKPLDLIQPYRLEMGTKMAVGRKKNLYGFGVKPSPKTQCGVGRCRAFVNLASTEYFKAIDTKLLKVPVITPVFKDMKMGVQSNHDLRQISKRLHDTLYSGYQGKNFGWFERLWLWDHFSEPQSSENELVFVR